MDKEQWNLLADEQECCLHIGCGGDCSDADGSWWCSSCLDYVEDDEVTGEYPETNER